MGLEYNPFPRIFEQLAKGSKNRLRTQVRSRKDFQEAKAYVSIMTDIEDKHVLDVNIRKSESADKPFNTLTDRRAVLKLSVLTSGDCSLQEQNIYLKLLSFMISSI